MFLGVVPRECLEQIVKIMPPDDWTDAYVCCSGTFRLDRCLNQAFPSVRVHSNDARYMTAEQQQRLTENLKRDGALTSVPLVWAQQAEDGTPEVDGKGRQTYEILSGNHRVTSAREAGFTEIDCMVVRNWISVQRRIELQLSHNAISGQDDQSILQQLYDSLDLGGKLYSGLTDDAFKGLQELKVTGLGVGQPDYQELLISFLPADAEAFKEHLGTIEKAAEKRTVHLAHILDFDKVFDAIVAVKEKRNVHNTALALLEMAELAVQRLAEIEAEGANGAEDEAA